MAALELFDISPIRHQGRIRPGELDPVPGDKLDAGAHRRDQLARRVRATIKRLDGLDLPMAELEAGLFSADGISDCRCLNQRRRALGEDITVGHARTGKALVGDLSRMGQALRQQLLEGERTVGQTFVSA